MTDSVVVERAEDLEQLRPDWERLAEHADNPFATWEWSSGWWRRFGAGKELFAFACRGGSGEVEAILPLYVDRRGPFRLARFIGEGDLRGPVCAEGGRQIAAAGLREVVGRGSDRCPLLIAERLPGQQGWEELIGGRRLATHPDPVLPLAGIGWEDFLSSRSRNFRQQVRRRERKLVEEHGLEFRLSEGDRFDQDFEALVSLHETRWGEETSGVFDGERGEFQREFALAAREHGWLRLWIAEIGGKAAAAWYGWRFAGSEWYYQAGRDPQFDDLSLGFVLLSHTIRAAADDGVDAYRFLDGGESYKWRFASADLEAETVALGRGVGGRLGALAAATAARAPSGARGRLARGGGS